MEIIVDSSVAVSVLHGGRNCRACLDVIRKNPFYTIVSCPDWAAHWNKVLGSADSRTPEHRKFLFEWKSAMLGRKKPITVESHPCFPIIKSKSEEWDKERLYLIAVAIQENCLILYCSTFSATCDRLSALDHPDIVSIRGNWKKSELPETVQWLRDNANGSDDAS